MSFELLRTEVQAGMDGYQIPSQARASYSRRYRKRQTNDEGADNRSI